VLWTGDRYSALAVLNLPVRDLKKSMDFLASLGFTFNPQFTDENAAWCSARTYAMLLREPYFETFTTRPSSQTQGILARLPVPAGACNPGDAARVDSDISTQQIGGDAGFVDEDNGHAARSASPSCHRRRAAATPGRRCSSASTVALNGQARLHRSFRSNA